MSEGEGLEFQSKQQKKGLINQPTLFPTKLQMGVITKIINLFRIIYYYTIHTFLWGSLMPYLSCKDVFDAGTLDGLRFIGVQVAMMGDACSEILNFKGIVLTAHKGFIDFYSTCATGFPSTVSRFDRLRF